MSPEFITGLDLHDALEIARTLKDKFFQHELPDGWEWLKPGDIQLHGDVVCDNRTPPIRVTVAGGVVADDIPVRRSCFKFRTHFLGQLNFYNLNTAAISLRRAYGPFVCLVGSSLVTAAYRDVDVRIMLPDVEFDSQFPLTGDCHRDVRWNLICSALSEWLRCRTGLPVDLQIQKFTAANEEFKGPRCMLGVNYDVPICPV